MGWLGDAIEGLIAVAFIIYTVINSIRQYRKRKAEPIVPPPNQWPEASADGADAAFPEALLIDDDTPAIVPRTADPHAELRDRFASLANDARILSRGARPNRATFPFAETLDEFVVPTARAASARLERTPPGSPPPELIDTAEQLEVVIAQLQVFIGQRRDPVLLPALGDADALALDCYRPVMAFARAHDLPLSSARPVTQLGGYELAIWTGFIPTGLAPIFLPSDFFSQVYWWPAIAHEIAHDFLAATRNTERLIREQLGVVSEAVGRAPLRVRQGGLPQREVTRLLGAWFEEIFCDVFGTLMLGPAYVHAMVELFATPDDPASTLLIALDATGRRYDVHPPRYLRLWICAAVLDLLGHEEHAQPLLDEWHELHGTPEAFLLQVRGGRVALPASPVIDLALHLVRRLYSEQLDGLAGYSLGRMPGIDYGPHAHAATERAAAQLLAGSAPTDGDASTVVAAAVLAARRAPRQASTIMRLARRGIPGVGTAEHRPDAYDSPAVAAPRRAHSGDDPRQAFLLHTLLAPPPALRRMKLGVARKGIVDRRGQLYK